MKWTTEDSTAARAQGWDIFHCEGSPHPWQLQRLDETSVFATDGLAHKHVRKLAAEKAPLALKALTFLYHRCLPEYKEVMDMEGLRVPVPERHYANKRKQERSS